MGGLSILGILRRHDMATSVRGEERPHGRRDDSDAFGIVRLEFGKRGEFAWHIGVVEEYSLFAERWFVIDPVADVLLVKGLCEYILWRNVGFFVLVDHLLSVGRLAAEHFLEMRLCVQIFSFEFRRKFGAQRLEELDALLVSQE